MLEGMIWAEGRFVSEHHERIARIIKDYDPNLYLAWIPPEAREPGVPDFAVMYSDNISPAYVVFTSDTCDERLVERLFSGDTKYNNVLDAIETGEAARDVIKMKEKMDIAEAEQDLIKHIVTSPKSRYRHGGKVYE